MKFFKKKKVQTSNDLYEAYKNEISGTNQKSNASSFSKILKLEVLVLAAGLFIMNQNTITLELNKIFVAENNILPVSIQNNHVDEDLVVTLNNSNFKEIEIREEEKDETHLENSNYTENNDLKLLIELLNTEFDNNKKIASKNRIVISQN